MTDVPPQVPPEVPPDVLDVFRLEGRVAVVTGAASGIGEAAARTLAAAGARVVAGDIDEGGLAQTTEAVAAAGGVAVGQRTDVTRRADVDALVDRGVSEFGQVDVMCNVAGIASDGMLADVTDEEFDRVFAINVKGVLYGCQAALRAMAPRRSGSIVNVSSTAIDAPVAGYGLYAMTKAAVAQLTMNFTPEAGRHGVRVNTIAPGATVTPFTARHSYGPDGTLNQEKFDAFVDLMRKMSPLRVVGEAMDQAYLILYLASDASRICTGQIWRANAGQAIVR